MLASRTAPQPLTQDARLDLERPRTVEIVVGGALELAIRSIEGLRDHVARVAMLRARTATAR